MVDVTVSLDRLGKDYRGTVKFDLAAQSYVFDVSIDKNGVEMERNGTRLSMSKVGNGARDYLQPLLDAKAMIDKQWSDDALYLVGGLHGKFSAHADVKKTLPDSEQLEAFLRAF